MQAAADEIVLAFPLVRLGERHGELLQSDYFHAGVTQLTPRESRSAQVTGQRIFKATVAVCHIDLCGAAGAPPFTIGSGASFMWSVLAFAISISGSGLSAAMTDCGAIAIRSKPIAVEPRI